MSRRNFSVASTVVFNRSTFHAHLDQRGSIAAATLYELALAWAPGTLLMDSSRSLPGKAVRAALLPILECLVQVLDGQHEEPGRRGEVLLDDEDDHGEEAAPDADVGAGGRRQPVDVPERTRFVFFLKSGTGASAAAHLPVPSTASACRSTTWETHVLELTAKTSEDLPLSTGRAEVCTA